MDLASPQSELPSAGSPATASERFNRVSWGNTGVGTSLYPVRVDVCFIDWDLYCVFGIPWLICRTMCGTGL